jgi:hypothetical protein
MGNAQCHAAQAARHRLDQKGALARGQHYAGKTRDALAAHRIADHRERFLADLLGFLKIARVDLPRRNKSRDLDCAGVLRARDRRSFLRRCFLFVLFALLFVIFGLILAPRAARYRRRAWPLQRRFVDRQGAGWRALTASLREVAILDEQKLVLADLVAARLVGCWDVFAGDGIDEPVPQAMAGAPIH